MNDDQYQNMTVPELLQLLHELRRMQERALARSQQDTDYPRSVWTRQTAVLTADIDAVTDVLLDNLGESSLGVREWYEMSLGVRELQPKEQPKEKESDVPWRMSLRTALDNFQRSRKDSPTKASSVSATCDLLEAIAYRLLVAEVREAL